MKTRARQREQTRERIVRAAVRCFSDKGFWGASTREIAACAGTNQGLITYHFRSKDELWKAAADHLFGALRERIRERLGGRDFADDRSRFREFVREFVRFNAEHPELFRFMVEEGKHDDERMQWLVDTHLKPAFDGMPAAVVGEGAQRAHAYYIMVGAASTLFAVAPECRRLTGLDPAARDAIERHADAVAHMVVP